jgi:hypothetical protein
MADAAAVHARLDADLTEMSKRGAERARMVATKPPSAEANEAFYRELALNALLREQDQEACAKYIKLLLSSTASMMPRNIDEYLSNPGHKV